VMRGATDAGIGLVPRPSLHRRRSTDPKPAFGPRAAPVSAPPRAGAVAEKPFVEPATTPPALQIFVRGFNDTEKKLLEGTVRLSQRRLPRLTLVPESEAPVADLVMIDGSDADAVAWADARPWLAQKKTIWIDSHLPRPGHTEAHRPVQWPLLPMLLARALEQVRGPQASPVTRDPAPAAAEPAAPARSNQVLVVDDSLAVRNHLRSLLEARGLQVTEASCVQEALAAVAANRFVCALMDVLMPDMDGYEGCKRIKGLKSSIGVLPVVMLTSKGSPFDRIRGKMAGCDAYLTKPVAPALLHAALDPYLGLAAAPPAAAPARRPIAGGQPARTLRG
jgi:two-component system, cell cycle response regulator